MPGTIENAAMGYLAYGCVKWVGYSLYAVRIHHVYEKDKSRPAVLDTDNRIAEDRACVECGYNLRTLDADAMCPECGALISKSSRANYAKTPLQSMRGWNSPFVVGIIRTLLGMAFGIAYFCFVGGVLKPSGNLMIGVILGLIPMRIIEWWILVMIFYDSNLSRSALGWNVVCGGVIVSFLLDVPAIMGIFMAGGVSIC